MLTKLLGQSRLTVAGAGLALVMAVASPPSFAQDASGLRLASETEEVADAASSPPSLTNPEPEPPRRRTNDTRFEAQGISVGTFRLYPQLEIGTAATSNATRSSGSDEGDVALRLRPEVRLESNWSRHRLNVTASAEMLRYSDNQDLATDDANLQAALRLDIRHATRLDVETGYGRSSTAASDSEVPDAAIGNRVNHNFSASAALNHDAGFGEGQLRAGLKRETFEDVALVGGGSEDNADRNYTEYQIALRGTFNNGAIIRPFVEAAYTPRLHDQNTDRNGLRRNSHGFALAAGLRFDDDPVWSGEVAATWLVRDYEDGSLGREQAPGLLASLLWRPTELTSINFNAAVALNETSDANEGARAAWNFGTTATHALRENIDVSAGLSIGFNEATGGHDRTLGAKLGLEWKANPYLAWGASYEGSWFDGYSDPDYSEHRLLASIILKR